MAVIDPKKYEPKEGGSDEPTTPKKAKCVHRFVGLSTKPGTLMPFYHHPSDPHTKVLNQYRCYVCARIMRKGKKWYYYMKCDLIVENGHAILDEDRTCGKHAVCMLHDPTHVVPYGGPKENNNYVCLGHIKDMDERGRAETTDEDWGRWRATPIGVQREPYSGRFVRDPKGYLLPKDEVLVFFTNGSEPQIVPDDNLSEEDRRQIIEQVEKDERRKNKV